jgi:hypothetical protein
MMKRGPITTGDAGGSKPVFASLTPVEQSLCGGRNSDPRSPNCSLVPLHA